MRKPPAPLEYHPYYESHRGWIRAWLDGDLRHDSVRTVIPRMPGVTEGLTTVVLTKRQAYGPAPYVGDPFVYVWFFAEDHLGRFVSGRCRIHYL